MVVVVAQAPKEQKSKEAKALAASNSSKGKKKVRARVRGCWCARAARREGDAFMTSLAWMAHQLGSGALRPPYLLVVHEADPLSTAALPAPSGSGESVDHRVAAHTIAS